MGDKDWKEILAVGLVENVPALLIMLGAALIVLGLTTGIHGWIAIDLPWARIVALVLGVFLMLAGVISKSYAKRMPDVKSLDVRIIHPDWNAEVRDVILDGTLAKTKLPKGFHLRVIKHYSKGAWAPIGGVHVNPDGTWQSDRCSIGGTPGDYIRVSVCLVGTTAKGLMEYFEQASWVHESGMKNAPIQLPPGVPRYLPPISFHPPDLIKCVSTQYKRDST